MKTTTASVVFVFTFLCCAFTQAQTITLTATNGQPSSYNLTTNQVVTVNSFISPVGYHSSGEARLTFGDGRKLKLASYAYGMSERWNSVGGVNTDALAFASGTTVFTGLTNIQIAALDSEFVTVFTFTITTPTLQSMIPANAVVIPSDATGPVQIVLESSSDLLNWTSALPGTYGSTYSNRFFRVRAIAQ